MSRLEYEYVDSAGNVCRLQTSRSRDEVSQFTLTNRGSEMAEVKIASDDPSAVLEMMADLLNIMAGALPEGRFVEQGTADDFPDDFEGRVRAKFLANWDDQPSANEAWKRMKYQCSQCENIEVVWNARPHVTPFGGLPCESCGVGDMSHIDWKADHYDREYRPQKGELIFIDMPPELAFIYARRTLDRHSGATASNVPRAEQLALSNLSQFGGHSPYVVRLRS